jgi:hypothetical protein
LLSNCSDDSHPAPNPGPAACKTAACATRRRKRKAKGDVCDNASPTHPCLFSPHLAQTSDCNRRLIFNTQSQRIRATVEEERRTVWRRSMHSSVSRFGESFFYRPVCRRIRATRLPANHINALSLRAVLSQSLSPGRSNQALTCSESAHSGCHTRIGKEDAETNGLTG